MEPTGKQYTIRGEAGSQHLEATITQVAASLRACTVNGTDILQRYPDHATPSLGAGIVMAPWPNRVDHGRWANGDTLEQLDITEVKNDNALHGLLRNTAYDVVAQSDDSLTLTAVIYAPNGYPFVVETFVTYAITPNGVEVTHSFRNHSGSPAPLAVGTHCYFKIGGVPTEDLVLTSTARTVYTDDARGLPISRSPVGGQFDVTHGIRAGDLSLDHCFTDMIARDGRFRTTLTAPDGRSVSVWTDENFAYQVLLTTDQFVDENGSATFAVAIEPQSSAVNAFNNREGLHDLSPGDDWVVQWGITPDL